MTLFVTHDRRDRSHRSVSSEGSSQTEMEHFGSLLPFLLGIEPPVFYSAGSAVGYIKARSFFASVRGAGKIV